MLGAGICSDRRQICLLEVRRFGFLVVRIIAVGIAIESLLAAANKTELYKSLVAWFPIAVEGILLVFVLHHIAPRVVRLSRFNHTQARMIRL
jgi:hypothetical protein